jgi:flavin reductase (DIM6/NTAB) family NADH-FMN oxidoreductase RutF
MDPAARSRVLRQLTYGLYVVTTKDADQTAAGTVNFVSQMAIEPPLVAVGMKTGSGIAVLADKSRRFAVNILGLGQKEIASSFFSPTVISGERINNVPFRPGADGLPILTAVPAAFVCRVEEIVRRGDHDLVVGCVTEVYEHRAMPPLTLASTGWFYGG